MMPPCKLKFRRLYFIFCKFYVAARAFEIEPFLCLRTYNHNNSAIVSITALSWPSAANVFAKLILERQTPQRHLYGTSHMSSVEPVSHKCIRSVGDASS